LKRAAHWLKNFIFKRRCVTEESEDVLQKRARVPAAEVSLCLHCVNAIPICWRHTEVFCFVLFLLFQVPDHILCLTVASG
jgi:hypothetical protein